MPNTDTIPRQWNMLFFLFGVDAPGMKKLKEQLPPEVPGIWCKEKTTVNGDPYLMVGAPAHAVKWLKLALDARKLRYKAKDPGGNGGKLPVLVPVGAVPPGWRPEKKLLPYQEEGVRFAAERPGSFFLWPAGCLTGDTIVRCNRAGRGFKIRLDELVRRFNGKLGGWDSEIPTMGQSMVNGIIRLNRIVAAVESGVKPVFQLVTRRGFIIKATAEHVFMRPGGGETKLGDLRAGDEVLVVPKRGGTPKKQVKNRYKTVRSNALACHPFACRSWSARRIPKVTEGGRRHGASWDIKIEEHRLVAEAVLNGMSLHEFVGRLVLDGPAGLKFIDPTLFHVHHKNGNHLDNSPSNLEVLPGIDHLSIHAREEGWQHVQFHAEPDVIISIKPIGKEPTYDLTMLSPHNNFVANGIVVHNSGKTAGALHWALFDTGRLGPVPAISTLIVCIAPTVVQWAREIAKFTTATSLIIGENCAAPLPGKAVYTSGTMLMAPPAAADQVKRPVAATPCSAAGIAKRHLAGETMWVVAKLTRDGVVWRRLVKAEFCHVGAGTDTVTAMPPARGDGLMPGWVLEFGEERVEPMPRFVIVGWEMMREYCDMLMGLGFTSMIVDEAQKASAKRRNVAVPQDDGSVEFKRLRNLTASIRALAGVIPRRLITTATPIMDRPKGLWAIVDTCQPYTLGSFNHFAPRYCARRPGMYGGWDDSGASNMEELRERLSFFVHQVSSKVARAALPTVRRMVFYLAPCDQNEAGDWRAEYKAAAAAGHGAEREVKLAEAAAKKRKYICGRVLETLNGKPDGKVLVLTGRRNDVELLGIAIRKALAAEGLADVLVTAVHGGYSQVERQQAVDDYRKSKTAVLVGTGESLGTGIDGMQCTDLQIHAMLPWTPGQIIQREGRVVRVGQDRPVLIEYVIAEGTYDERVAELLINKLPAVETVVQNDEIMGLGKELAYGDADEATLTKSVVDMVDASGFADED